jgi:XapX domain-containing protein
MKVYIVSLAAGILVGLIYTGLQVRSPAPPAVALIGLLGMLIGEQAGPIAKRMISREPITAAWLHAECVTRITGVGPAPTVQAKADKADGVDGTPGGQGHAG